VNRFRLLRRHTAVLTLHSWSANNSELISFCTYKSRSLRNVAPIRDTNFANRAY